MTDLSSRQPAAGSKEPDPNFIRWVKENCVPILSLALVVLLPCLVGHYTSIAIDWSKINDFTDAFSNTTQGLGLIAGAVWAYFRFVKGRTFQESLIPIVSGRLLFIEGSAFLIVTTQIKNVGSSKVTFDREMSALTIFEYIPEETDESCHSRR